MTIFEMEMPFRSAFQLYQERFVTSESPKGPKVTIFAGLHGNEVNGIYVANLLIQHLLHYCQSGHSILGEITIVPAVNTVGIDETKKRFPLDKRDINQSFPGHEQGSPSQRIAHVLQEVSAHSQWVMSIHSGASHVHDIAQVRVHPQHHHLALQMGLPLLLLQEKLDSNASLLGFCHQRGQETIYVSAGRGEMIDIVQSTQLLQAIWRWLIAIAVLPEQVLDWPCPVPFVVKNEHLWEIRSSNSGFFVATVTVGQWVQKGEKLGHLEQVLGGGLKQEIFAEEAALVCSVRSNPIVHYQELLFKMAQKTDI